MEKTPEQIRTAPPSRNIEAITAEIKELQRQARQVAVSYAVEIGRRLCEAKQILPHGEWGEWLSEKVEFSQSTANNFMKIFDEYGSEQISVFGAVVNSQTIANLPYSKALALLSVPKEEREEFAEKNGDMSVKELQSAIRERNEAIERQKNLENAAKQADEARKAAEARAAEADKLRAELETARDNLKKSIEQEGKISDKLKKALEHPEIPKSEKEKIQETATKTAEENIKTKIEEMNLRLKEADSAKAIAEAMAKSTEERLKELQGKLKTASPEVTAFKTLFERLQDDIFILKKQLSKIKETDPETAGRLGKALAALGRTVITDDQ